MAQGEREKICECLPSFKVAIFLKGLSQGDNQDDLGLVRRVMMYGGSLPEWRWALGAGEWKESYQECVEESEALRRMTIEYYAPFLTKGKR